MTRKTYLWILLGGFLVAGVGLWMELGVGQKVEMVASAEGCDVIAGSSTQVENAAEKARRMAIARLGPLKHKQGTNGADLYKQAMGLYAGLSEDEKDMLKHWRDRPDPKAAEALHLKIQPIMELLRRARKADYVDWGMGPMSFDDMSDRSGQYRAVQALAALASWEATCRFGSDPSGALADLAAMEAMGRSEADSAVGLMVEDGIHFLGMNVMAYSASSITNADDPNLAYVLDPAAVARAFQTGLRGEATMVQAGLGAYADLATRKQTTIQKWVTSGTVTPQEVVSQMQWLSQTEQALAYTLKEPDGQFQQWWNRKLAEAASMPLASSALSAMGDIRTLAVASMAESAMLEAGLALEQGDQQGFLAIGDPASGKPFAYKETADGFQLSSVLQRKGRPVSLSFSLAGK